MPSGLRLPAPTSSSLDLLPLIFSADGLFIRAGVNKGTQSSRVGGTASAETRCTIKRIHVELHRVLGGEVSSLKEFKSALSACVRDGGEGRGRGCALLLLS